MGGITLYPTENISDKFHQTGGTISTKSKAHNVVPIFLYVSWTKWEMPEDWYPILYLVLEIPTVYQQIDTPHSQYSYKIWEPNSIGWFFSPNIFSPLNPPAPAADIRTLQQTPPWWNRGNRTPWHSQRSWRSPTNHKPPGSDAWPWWWLINFQKRVDYWWTRKCRAWGQGPSGMKHRMHLLREKKNSFNSRHLSFSRCSVIIIIKTYIKNKTSNRRDEQYRKACRTVPNGKVLDHSSPGTYRSSVGLLSSSSISGVTWWCPKCHVCGFMLPCLYIYTHIYISSPANLEKYEMTLW